MLFFVVFLFSTVSGLPYIERKRNDEFWKVINTQSIIHSSNSYNGIIGEKICFTCPISRQIYNDLYDEKSRLANTPGEAPPRLVISWYVHKNNRVVYLCKNDTKINSYDPIYVSKTTQHYQTNYIDDNQLDFSCENQRLCLNYLKNGSPENYFCNIASKHLNVKLKVLVDLKSLIYDLNEKYNY
jgi:hypothetical protein